MSEHHLYNRMIRYTFLVLIGAMVPVKQYFRVVPVWNLQTPEILIADGISTKGIFLILTRLLGNTSTKRV